jgi:hypothetical protein
MSATKSMGKLGAAPSPGVQDSYFFLCTGTAKAQT